MVTEAAPFSAARRGRAGERALRVLLAAGLALDAAVHADLARFYPAGGRAVSEQALFLAEAAVAAAAALLVLVMVHRRWVHVAALVVAASALAAVMSYRYVDIGAFGPVPDLYEPAWYPEKVIGAVAEAIAVLAAVALLLCRSSRAVTRPVRRP
ncbi:hypothetical protein LWC35_24280 [Pseudonocardia kujensis]|uniref:hypothetical protein n=1 Tax=Pseudonocardia kujensis TaxID=1128675 RepID=UPI001E32275E|nr:hypothetical protein [Pseudonocardia kujensis]MCE0765997.1 hypothetical protein [Pseudonocardia kujensis]